MTGELFNLMVSLDERRHRDGTCPRGRMNAEFAAKWEREDTNRTPKTRTEPDVPPDLLFTEHDLDDPNEFDDAGVTPEATTTPRRRRAAGPACDHAPAEGATTSRRLVWCALPPP